jgi:hypothetical protein
MKRKPFVFVLTDITTPSTPAPLPMSQVTVTPAIQAAAHGAALSLATSNAAAVQQKHAELTANGGIMPASWVPFADAIKLAAQIVELFAGPELKAICQVVITAINAAEGND